eukprot:g4486.t1
MMRERTFIMIKPDGVQRGIVGKIIARFEQKGLKLVSIKSAEPKRALLEQHYADLKGKSFFEGLMKYMLSGPVICMIWEGDGAVATGRVLLGATNPADSRPGTIRGDLCISVGRNVCHGSDSVESAEKEINLWFGTSINSWKDHSEPWIYECKSIENSNDNSPVERDMKKIVLFDVDGTLTPARKTVTPDIIAMLHALRKHCLIGYVGGSDLVKQKEQLGENMLDLFDFGFSENGLCAFRDGQPLASQTFAKFIGEEKMKKLVNFCLAYMAKLDLPVKRGTFIEFRTGMINVSPIGRNCSKEERNAYEQYDLKHNVRKDFVAALEKEFAGDGIKFSIGGQISFDVFPEGWDKTYCLRFLEDLDLQEIHFFGDKTYKGGNDYEIYHHERVQGHAVKSPDDTLRIVNELFLTN